MYLTLERERGTAAGTLLKPGQRRGTTIVVNLHLTAFVLLCPLQAAAYVLGKF
jgi:hypothetical protein